MVNGRELIFVGNSDIPMDGEIASEGECARCGREGIVLLDGTLCEDCHPEVWSDYEDRITRFGLLRTHDDGPLSGELVAVGVAIGGDRATLGWIYGPPSAEMYEGLEGVQRVYEKRENLAIVYG